MPLKSQESKFKIGIIGSADVAYRSLFLEEGRDDIAFIVDARENREIPKFGYSCGVNISYSLGSNFILNSGLQYSNMGYKTKPFLLISGNFDPRRGFIYQGEPFNWYNVYCYHYVEIPISIQFQVGKKKWKPILAVGISPGYIASGTRMVVEVFDEGGKSRSLDKMDISTANRFSITPFANLGVNYQINDLWSIQASAHFRYNLVNLYDTPITESHWNGGLQIGCFYSFK